MPYFQLMGFGPLGWGLPMLIAAAMTFAVALAAMMIGAVFGAIGAAAKLSSSTVARGIADGYTTILRGVPDLLVIYLFYFGG
jgi:octopine/nopaline transport system permease protein